MAQPKSSNWIVKDTVDKIYGPFTTEQVLAQIDKGYFIGEEMVAIYPGGNWVPISRASEFTDRILDVLAMDSKAVRPALSQKSRSSSKMPDPSRNTDDEKTVQSSKGPKAVPADETQPRQNSSAVNAGHATISNRTSNNSANPRPNRNSIRTDVQALDQSQDESNDDSGVIVLEDLRSAEVNAKVRQAKLPLMVFGGVLVLAMLTLFFRDVAQKPMSRTHLILPRLNQAALGSNEIKGKLRVGISAFQTDTYSGYARAQDALVQAVEGSVQSSETPRGRSELMSTLCLVYRELWPFSYQDSQDVKAISLMTQEAKRLDPGGVNGGLCEIVHLLTIGRDQDAQNLTDSMLVEDSQVPVLFEIRGESYFNHQDYGNAAAYFSQARTLWSGWQKIPVSEGRARVKTQEYTAATELFRGVLKTVRDHPVAKIEMGWLEFEQFGHMDSALKLFQNAMDGDEKVTREESARGQLGIAEVYVQRKNFRRAVEAAKKSYQFDPRSARAKEIIQKFGGKGLPKTSTDPDEHIFLGKQYQRMGDYLSAQAEFKTAFDIDPKNAGAAMEAGKCLWKLNQSEEAIEWLKRAIQVDHELIAAYVELADELAQRYDYYSASRALLEAQHLSAQNYEVWRGFSQLELRRNDFKSATIYAGRALKIYETDIDTLLIMAKAQLGLGAVSEGKRYAGRAVELDYNNTQAQTIYAKAIAAEQGVDAGAGYLRNLIDHYVITAGQQIPQAAIEYRIGLGEIYMKDERFAQAEQVFLQAISLDRNNKLALMNLGKSMAAQNRLPEALEAYLKAAVLDPSDAEPIFQSALVYQDVGKISDAIRQFQRVLTINPRYPRAHSALGRALIRLGQAKPALEQAMEERKLNPDLSESYTLAGEAYFLLGQYSNCASEYQRAASKNNKTAQTLIRMARCYRLSGALESATSLLRQAQAIESGNPDLYKEQGALFNTLGKPDEALVAYDTYLKLVPTAQDRAEIENQMRKIQAGDVGVGGG